MVAWFRTVFRNEKLQVVNRVLNLIKSWNKKRSLLFCVAAFLSGFCFAQGSEEKVGLLFDLPLEALASLQVEVAVQRPQKLEDAPGLISVVSRFELDAYGGNYLAEILNRQPSAQIANGGAALYNQVTFRGQNFSSLDQHHLYLINGRPIRNTPYKGVNRSVLYSFPVSVLDQVEVIRGPGSVIYGTNAFAGVINLRTNLNLKNETWAAVIAGDNNTQGAEVGFQETEGDFSLLVNAKVFNAGTEKVQIGDISGQYRNQELWQDSKSFFIDSRYKGWRFTATELYHDLPGLELFRWTEPGQQTEVTENVDQHVNLGYEKSIGEHKLHFDFTFNENGIDKRYDPSFEGGDSRLYEISASGPLIAGASHRYLVGAIYEKERFDAVEIQARENQNQSTYFQIEYFILDELNLTTGLQWNNPERIESDATPRLSLVWDITPSWTLKSQYSEAYRAPSAADYSLRVVDPLVVIANEKIKPENITTSEIELRYADTRQTHSMAIYQSTIKDLIGFEQGPEIATTANRGKADFEGVEYDAKYQLNPRWYLSGNFSWQTYDVVVDDLDQAPLPEVMAKLGIAYQEKNWILGFFNSYFDATPLFNDDDTNPEPESYVLGSLNITYLPNRFENKLSVSLFVDNLYDEEVWYSRVANNNLNSLPNNKRRNTTFTLKYSF